MSCCYYGKLRDRKCCCDVHGRRTRLTKVDHSPTTTYEKAQNDIVATSVLYEDRTHEESKPIQLYAGQHVTESVIWLV